MWAWLRLISQKQDYWLVEIKTLEDMKAAAQKLHELGAPAVIIKGGNRLSQDKAVDVFMMDRPLQSLENPVIQGQNAGAGLYPCL